jgi:hypothetical protein
MYLSVTVELLLMARCFAECVLISLPMEEYNVRSKTADFCEICDIPEDNDLHCYRREKYPGRQRSSIL